MTLIELLNKAPDNLAIQDAIEKCFHIINSHNKILCAVSGGADSDVMLDLMVMCGAIGKTTFVFFNTGLEYAATLEHLDELECKYGITIERHHAIRSIPYCVNKYGVPFISKFSSEMIYRLQRHNFQWEDEPFEVLYERYPKCKTALEWWCNVTKGNTTQYVIKRYSYLKEFMIENPPQFLISNKCCEYAKKGIAEKLVTSGGFDLNCMGVRKAEGGIRSAAFNECFTEGSKVDYFRPIFWPSDADKEVYCTHYGVTHSRCYTEYGLLRTGCFGCPFGKRFEEELRIIANYEPRLLKAATNIFRSSYEYTRAYLDFRERKKAEKREQEVLHS